MKKKIMILAAVILGLSLQEANTQKENANFDDMILAANDRNDFAIVSRDAKEAGVLQSNWRTMLQGAITSNPSISWEDGSRYKGQNRSNGIGAYYWNDTEDMYFGSFKDNKMDGYGLFIWGNTRNLATCPGCKYYAGYWSNNQKIGVGACYDTNGKLIYNGNFRDDKPTDTYPTAGTGYNSYKLETMDFNDVNAKYIGETYNGRQHGFGIFVWSDGNVFFGWWKDGARNGDGILIYNNGNINNGILPLQRTSNTLVKNSNNGILPLQRVNKVNIII